MTIRKSHETIESLRSLVGNKLAQATHLLFVFDDEYDYNTPLAVSLQFSDGKRSGKIVGGSDGLSVGIDLSEMQSVDMQENGKQCIFDASGTPLWQGSIGKKLEKINFVVDSSGIHVLGFELRFYGGGSVVIINIGDQTGSGSGLTIQHSPVSVSLNHGAWSGLISASGGRSCLLSQTGR